tara:strand:+ start:615 stop:899 length:285 start_codon:yes stop_codon:yes gene_type:complete
MAQTQVYNATTKQYVTLEVNDDLVNNSLVEEDRLQQAKVERNILLQKSDWTTFTDSPLTDEQKAEAVTYRQALRDLPAQNGFPNIAFPTKPDFL